VTKTPEEKRTEPGEVDQGYWQKTTLEAFKNDPLRMVIELIKNSADSYTRLRKKENVTPPFEISVRFFCRKKKPPSIEVLDHAQGMDSTKLKQALKYGTQTSMGEDTEAVTSAEKGIGLKHAMMALRGNWLITIKDGLINERNKHLDFTTGFGKEDEKVTDEERKKLAIPSNGTLITGTLPEYFHERKFATICERLQQHFLLRKLLQNTDYRVYVFDGWTKEKRVLEYRPPKTEKEILKESFKIVYNGKEYNIDLSINKTGEGLTQGKPFGDSGLLFYYGEYSVVDFTFCRYDKDFSFSRFFGEAKMGIETLIRDPNEAPLVDEKRRGLDPEHPFNKKLFGEINQKLRGIQEEEEESRYFFDEYELKNVLRELNRIYKEIKGRGPPPEPPIKPETYAFYPVYASIKEYELRTVFLIINSVITKDGFEISLQSTNPDIIVKQPTIKIEENAKQEFIIKQVQLYSEKPEIKGEIVATPVFPPYLEPEKMGVEVLENPIFSPTNGFAFVPDKTSIVDGGEKKVDLCIDRGLVKSCSDIVIASEDPVVCPGKLTLPSQENLEKCVRKNIAKIEIPMKTKGTEHIGEKATVKASYGDKATSLTVTIVPEPTISGLFRNVRPSAKNTKKISDFITDEGILEIYYKHPLFQKYMKKGFISKMDFLVFVADTLTREAVKACVLTGIEENSSRFRIFDMENPEKEIEGHIDREYFEQGPKMHEMFMKLARTFKLGEE